jgi:hypothetical protein
MNSDLKFSEEFVCVWVAKSINRKHCTWVILQEEPGVAVFHLMETDHELRKHCEIIAARDRQSLIDAANEAEDLLEKIDDHSRRLDFLDECLMLDRRD